MALTGNELPKDPKGWVEHLQKIDFKDHKKAMIGVGTAALFGLGAGVYALSRKEGGGKFFVGPGDRRMEAKGVTSIGKLEEHGEAVGVPTSEDALEKIGKGREVFSMGEDGFGFPLENPDDIAKHTKVLKAAAGWLKDHFSSQEARPPAAETE